MVTPAKHLLPPTPRVSVGKKDDPNWNFASKNTTDHFVEERLNEITPRKTWMKIPTTGPTLLRTSWDIQGNSTMGSVDGAPGLSRCGVQHATFGGSSYATGFRGGQYRGEVGGQMGRQELRIRRRANLGTIGDTAVYTLF